MNRLSITGVVLAGGQSSRMGADKASLPFGEQSLLRRMVSILEPLTSDILVAPGRRRGDEPPGTRVVEDAFAGRGPLAGIHAALAAAASERILVVTVDMPFLTASFLADLAAVSAGWDITIPDGGRGIEPLVGVYAASCLAPAAAMLERGEHSVAALTRRGELRVKVLPPEWVRRRDPDGLCILNINSPEDYRRALTLIH